MKADNLMGVEMITQERIRQMTEEGWTAEHDDEHDACDMAQAAVAYVVHVVEQVNGMCDDEHRAIELWPWAEREWKPSDEPIRNLVKAGALIAAEIDRLERQRSRGVTS